MNKTKVYNKLIRDNLIDIIKKDNREPIYRILSREEYWLCLLEKDTEELNEVKNATTLEEIKNELADKLELIIAMANFNNLTLQDIMVTADKKRKINGGFKKQIYLEKIHIK